jgi:hypothetical protein
MRSAGVVSFTLTTVTVFVIRVFRVVDIAGLRRTVGAGVVGLCRADGARRSSLTVRGTRVTG